MAIHRRAFALILVLVAVSATFALAIQGAVAMRTAVAEASAMRVRAGLERRATSAASVALAALTAGEALRTDAFGSSSGSSGGGGAPKLDETELPDMPPEMKELLLGLLNKNKKPETDDGGASSNMSVVRESGGAYEALRKRGVPEAPIAVTIESNAFDVHFIDAAGGVNINVAEEDQLVRYFRAKGIVDPLATSLAHEILDWRDEDSVPRTRGREREQYLAREITIRNGDFQTIEELLYLPSMTPELLALMYDELTLVGEGKIHVPTASQAVLMSAPDLTPQAAGRILALRESGQMTERSLSDALGALSADAMSMFRLEPSSVLRVRIEPQGGGPAFRADVIVGDHGAQLFNVRMISR